MEKIVVPRVLKPKYTTKCKLQISYTSDSYYCSFETADKALNFTIPLGTAERIPSEALTVLHTFEGTLLTTYYVHKNTLPNLQADVLDLATFLKKHPQQTKITSVEGNYVWDGK